MRRTRNSKIAAQIKEAKAEAKLVSKTHGSRSLEAIHARRWILELENTQLTRQLAYQKRQQAAMSERLRQAILGQSNQHRGGMGQAQAECSMEE